MTTQSLQTLLTKYPVVLADGAMGTMLQAAGLEPGTSPVEWNATHPEQVTAVHRAYRQAGARILLSNTFVGSRFRLAHYGLEGRLAELNRIGAQLARQVAAEAQDVLVAGDIGPSGLLLAPLGSLRFEEAVAGFAEQAAALVKGGADFLLIETMSDLKEVEAAIQGIRQVTDRPIAATLTFDTHGRTMMGVKPEQAAETLLGWGVVAIGGNCGNGPDEIQEVVRKMRAAAPQAPVIAKANAGLPELIDDQVVFRGTPAVMADYARRVRDLGATIIGGCCGTTPAHIAAMAEALG